VTGKQADIMVLDDEAAEQPLTSGLNLFLIYLCLSCLISVMAQAAMAGTLNYIN
jgi:hypothetical protein